MKIVYGYLDPGVFYKLELNSATLNSVYNAIDLMCDCPYEGVLFIDAPIYNITDKKWEMSKITISCFNNNTYVNVRIYDENLLQDDLIEIPIVHLTRKFKIMIEDAKKVLSKDDLDLIETWQP